MNELKFKTNINCTGCLSKVTPVLDNENQIEAWAVDLASIDRILTVQSTGLTAGEIKNTVQKAGFNAELIEL
ncbi:MAG: heavy-metal-associated domain-containing protein [Lewinellaceae bacterium]|nr:heavy-metal-associated domain-containing protein [Lewinellaceae bacterium]